MKKKNLNKIKKKKKIYNEKIKKLNKLKIRAGVGQKKKFF
jgi:hypothetical protein